MLRDWLSLRFTLHPYYDIIGCTERASALHHLGEGYWHGYPEFLLFLLFFLFHFFFVLFPVHFQTNSILSRVMPILITSLNKITPRWMYVCNVMSTISNPSNTTNHQLWRRFFVHLSGAIVQKFCTLLSWQGPAASFELKQSKQEWSKQQATRQHSMLGYNSWRPVPVQLFRNPSQGIAQDPSSITNHPAFQKTFVFISPNERCTAFHSSRDVDS